MDYYYYYYDESACDVNDLFLNSRVSSCRYLVLTRYYDFCFILVSLCNVIIISLLLLLLLYWYTTTMRYYFLFRSCVCITRSNAQTIGLVYLWTVVTCYKAFDNRSWYNIKIDKKLKLRKYREQVSVIF